MACSYHGAVQEAAVPQAGRTLRPYDVVVTFPRSGQGSRQCIHLCTEEEAVARLEPQSMSGPSSKSRISHCPVHNPHPPHDVPSLDPLSSPGK
jgi:hypothetical protein